MRLRKAVFILLAAILIPAACAGCGHKLQKQTETAPENTVIAAAYGIGYETEKLKAVPQAVIDYATEYTLEDLNFYQIECGYEIEETKITGLTKLQNGAANLEIEIQMWLLEYRMKPSDPEEITLAGGMSMEDELLTEYGSTGQPILVMVYSSADKAYERIGITRTLTVDEEFGGDYTKAAMSMYNEWKRKNEENP